MEKCDKCGQIPECGEVECEVCRCTGCDYCVPETDCGHSVCFRCLENLEEQAREQAKKRIAELEIKLATALNRADLFDKLVEIVSAFKFVLEGLPEKVLGMADDGEDKQWPLRNEFIDRITTLLAKIKELEDGK